MSDNQDPVTKFSQFFREHCGDSVSSLAIADPDGKHSLTVNWQELADFDTDLAERLLSYPDAVTGYAREALINMGINRDEKRGHPHIRIQNIDTENAVQSLSATSTGSLVSISGLLEAVTNVHPISTVTTFECEKCDKSITGRWFGLKIQEPAACPSCGATDCFEIEIDSFCVDGQYARLRVTEPDSERGAPADTIQIRLIDDLTPVTVGNTVTVTGIIRPSKSADLDQRTTVQDRFVDCYDVVPRSNSRPKVTSLSNNQSFCELSSRSDYLGSLLETIAPAIPGFWHAKLACLLQYVQPTLPSSNSEEDRIHVLIVSSQEESRRRLLKQWCEHISGAEYLSATGDQMYPAVAEVHTTASGCWLETGPLVWAAGSTGAIDAIEDVSRDQYPLIIQTMAGEEVTISSGGMHVPLNTCNEIVATTSPSKEMGHDDLTALTLDDDLLAAFDILVKGTTDCEMKTAISQTWSRDGEPETDTRMENHTASNPIDYRRVLEHAREMPEPSLLKVALPQQPSIDMDWVTHRGLSPQDVHVWIVKALARLSGRTTVTNLDVERSQRLAAIL